MYIVVCHGYGLTTGNKLPPAEKLVLREALRVGFESPESCYVVGSWSKLGAAGDIEHRKKEAVLKRFPGATVTRSRPVDNTADEIVAWTEMFKEHLADKSTTVMVVAARHHWGLKYLWKRHLRECGLSPEIMFIFVGQAGMWGDFMPSPWQRSTLRWCIAGIIRVILYRIYGIEARHKANHPYKTVQQ